MSSAKLGGTEEYTDKYKFPDIGEFHVQKVCTRLSILPPPFGEPGYEAILSMKEK